jgi:hypothetical protein
MLLIDLQKDRLASFKREQPYIKTTSGHRCTVSLSRAGNSPMVEMSVRLVILETFNLLKREQFSKTKRSVQLE